MRDELRRLCRSDILSLFDSGRHILRFGFDVDIDRGDAETVPILEFIYCNFTPVGRRPFLCADFAYALLVGVITHTSLHVKAFPVRVYPSHACV